jgi:FlaA1/EpsC-like NDP-sugar epimerase
VRHFIEQAGAFLTKARHPATVFLHDLIMVPLAWVGAFWLRFNLDPIPEPFLTTALHTLVPLLAIQALMFWAFGMYRGIWRFASLPDLARILKAVLFGAAATMALLFVFWRPEGIPRSVPILYSILLMLLLSGPRLMYRWFKDYRFRVKDGKRVLIVGAGKAGELLLRDLIRSPQRAYIPVAFVDDRRKLWGKEIHGIPVIGGCDLLPRIARDFRIEVVVLAVPSASSAQMQRLVELVESTGLPFRTVPELESLMAGRIRIDALREVSIEDLLGREPISLDWKSIESGLAGRTVLVTGAGGSIGAELSRQIARLEPKRLVLLDRNEFNLYRIELELQRGHPAVDLDFVLGDVADPVQVGNVFSRFRPDVVFHAAAYKHVPMLETQVRAAVANNVFGTRNLAEHATRYGCAEFVLISTDKAVNPANVMGATKRVAEIFCQNLNARTRTKFITVRFGNVMGSAGSVIPLFREQIASGGPVTVTHPEMERYFMTIPEACQLITQASVLGQGGEIFVLDMGKPVAIRYLAEQMILLSGRVPDKDIRIEYIGLRPGEKLREELFHQREHLLATRHEKIRLALHRPTEWSVMLDRLDGLREAVARYDETRMVQLLTELVPEHRLELDSQRHRRDNVIVLDSSR